MKKLLILAPFALAACAQEPEPAPAETQTTSAPRTLVAAGLNDQELGPKIVGPQGPEVTDEMFFEGRKIAEMVSYVACPASEEDEEAAEECDPAARNQDAVYTYVHRITPSEGSDGPITTFRTSRSATGFANNIGFDRPQAEAALGEDYEIGIQIDNGALIWRIEAGDGWQADEEVTFFWQSTLPPEGPAQAYEIETAEGSARATGPFPPEDMPDERAVEQ